MTGKKRINAYLGDAWQLADVYARECGMSKSMFLRGLIRERGAAYAEELSVAKRSRRPIRMKRLSVNMVGAEPIRRAMNHKRREEK